MGDAAGGSTDNGPGPATGHAAWHYTYHLGFADCDPAGIAYTGALVNAALRALDRFVAAVTDGRGWFAMNVQMGAGLPFVRLETDFAAPVRGDADIDFALSVTRLGETSCGFRIAGSQGGRACFETRSVSVFVTRGPEGAVKTPLPDWLRSALAPYAEPAR